jgi:hypothetical protein
MVKAVVASCQPRAKDGIAMTLRPTDMLEIQSAIDEYERKFPRRPAPSAEVALAWRLGKREYARRVKANPDLAFNSQKQADAAPKRPDAAQKQADAAQKRPDADPKRPDAAQKQADAAQKKADAAQKQADVGKKQADAALAEQECNRVVWGWQQFRLQWQTLRHSADQPPRYSEFVPWVKTALLVGWWGAVAVLVASVFLFGALVGGFK